MNVRFGDWELRKLDANNWELYHFGVTTGRGSNMSDGKPRWKGTGHYYQHNTIHLALEYAADWELRNHDDGKVDLGEYVRAYGDTLERFRAAFETSVLSL